MEAEADHHVTSLQAGLRPRQSPVPVQRFRQKEEWGLSLSRPETKLMINFSGLWEDYFLRQLLVPLFEDPHQTLSEQLSRLLGSIFSIRGREVQGLTSQQPERSLKTVDHINMAPGGSVRPITSLYPVKPLISLFPWAESNFLHLNFNRRCVLRYLCWSSSFIFNKSSLLSN